MESRVDDLTERVESSLKSIEEKEQLLIKKYEDNDEKWASQLNRILKFLLSTRRVETIVWAFAFFVISFTIAIFILGGIEKLFSVRLFELYAIAQPNDTELDTWDVIKKVFLVYMTGIVVLLTFAGIVFHFYNIKNSRNTKDDFQKIAIAMHDPFSIKLKEIRGLVSDTEKLASTLHANFEPYMISWSVSREVEAEAQNVDVLTRDLAWVFEETSSGAKVIDDIFKEILSNCECRYRYLVYRATNPDTAIPIWHPTAVMESIEWITEKYQKLNKKQKEKVAKQLRIKFLKQEDNVLSSDALSLENPSRLTIDINYLNREVASLPLPGDMVLYSRLGEKGNRIAAGSGAVLISARGVVGSPSLPPEEMFDFLYTSQSQTSAFEIWFKSAWGADY